MFLLDTNVVSELRKAKSGKADPGVTAWAKSTPASLMFLSVVSLLELEHGVLLLERRDPVQGELLRLWLEESVVPAFEHRCLPIDSSVARRAAALHVPDPAPFRDALIGATAEVHELVVVTRNVRDFESFSDVVADNPWS